MNKALLLAALVAAFYVASTPGCGTSDPPSASDSQTAVLSRPGDDAAVEQAYAQRLVNHQLAGRGRVVKLLPDDLNGSRHQRFIVQLDSGRTLLVSHNIDLAPRIAGLATGDEVAFYGEYEWNPKGGVIHWTHHDPEGRHVAGWIRHQGRTYQ